MSQAGDDAEDRTREQHTDQDIGQDTEQDKRQQEISGFIEKFSGVLIAAGFPPMSARVFAALHVSESSRLTAAELASILQVSPAAVSGAVRYLSGLGMLLRERTPGSRREQYRLPEDIWQRVRQQQIQVLHQWSALLREGADLVGPDTRAGQRMTGDADFFAFLSREMPALQTRWETESGLGSSS